MSKLKDSKEFSFQYRFFIIHLLLVLKQRLAQMQNLALKLLQKKRKEIEILIDYRLQDLEVKQYSYQIFFLSGIALIDLPWLQSLLKFLGIQENLEYHENQYHSISFLLKLNNSIIFRLIRILYVMIEHTACWKLFRKDQEYHLDRK